MVNTTLALFILLILLNIVFFILGYLIGKISNSQPIFERQHKVNKWSNSTTEKITIDDSKVVTDISLSGLEKKYDELGEIKISNDNIESSVDKLKNLKR